MFRVKNRERVDSGTSTSLENAKAAAEKAAREAGLNGALNWQNIGPRLP